MSSYWTEGPENMLLHIIVQLPCTFLTFYVYDFSLCLTGDTPAPERPAKKRRLDGDCEGKIAYIRRLSFTNCQSSTKCYVDAVG